MALNYINVDQILYNTIAHSDVTKVHSSLHSLHTRTYTYIYMEQLITVE